MFLSSELKVLALDPNSFSRTWKVLEQGVSEGVAPGFVAGFWEKRNPDQIVLGAIGQRRVIPSPLPMTTDTVFDLASVSKVFATAALCGVLVERAWLSWDTPVKEILTEYPYGDIKVWHLLSHTAGLVWWQPLWESMVLHFQRFYSEPIRNVSIRERQQLMRELVFSLSPEELPGVRAVYSDISFLLLGFLLEELTQMPLDLAVEKFVWKPMGITQASYHRSIEGCRGPAPVMQEVAATEDCPDRGGVLQGEVHDDNCWAMGGYGGHAGVFASAQDVLHFARGMMTGFLSPATWGAMCRPVSSLVGCTRTLGWDSPSERDSSTGSLFSRHSVGHLGFTGTSLWIDLEAELAVVLFSNRVHPTRENLKIKEMRPKFHDSLRSDLAY